MKRALCVGICLIGSIHAQNAEDVFRAIRANDLDALRRMPADVKDRLNTTPLHYAALYGSVDAVRILLDRGADVKARNKSEATPLIYGSYNFDKARLLVDKGSEVNARSAAGMTPLLLAVSVHGNTATVRYLLEKGADPKLKDNAGFTALLNAFSTPDQERVRVLLDAGSDVNAANTFSGAVKNGPIALNHMTPLFLAAPDVPPATVTALLKAGAHPDECDQRKLTPLMAAIQTDEPRLPTIHQLIAAGADVNAKDQNGESVLDWALKYGNPEIIALLKASGANISKPFTAPRRPADFMAGAPKDAIARSSALLAKSGETFFPEGGGCVGCHHQPLMARAYAALRAANRNPDERLHRVFSDAMVANRPFMLSNYPQLVSRGGDYDENLAQSEAWIALGETATPTTDAILHYLASRQEPSGAWAITGLARAPLETGAITRTALAIRALKTYGWPARRAEFDERIARARAWLLAARPATSYEAAERIKGLKSAGASEREIGTAAQALLKQQRADGGWSQTPYLDSDAYATGMVLSTLYTEGLLKSSDAAYTRGTAYLLKTQFPDGSWYVRSRAPKLQPYFQSAFPFDHDQWISASATALAVMALAPSSEF